LKYNTATIAERKTLKEKTLNIYIGWDSREPIAADVCRYSIIKNSSIKVNVIYLNQEELREQGLYWRSPDDLGSTEFTFTRFLVPYLNNYEGLAVFVDCDFLYVEDIAKLIQQIDTSKAVSVVQHDYTPPEGVKMDGQKQLPYPRKNWSSMIVWNCSHKANKKVNTNFVNTATGQELHRFTWLKNSDIGNVSPEWNWLVGWYREYRDGLPSAIHYTEGGPWFNEYKDCEYADIWNHYKDQYLEYIDDRDAFDFNILALPEEVKIHFKNLLLAKTDPKKMQYEYDLKDSLNFFTEANAKCVGILDNDIEDDNGGKDLSKDAILEDFLVGANGRIGAGKEVMDLPLEVPAAIRGIVKKKLIHKCHEIGRDYYYIDTGYFGNDKKKHYHRITKNAMQYLGELDTNCPDDRFKRTGVALTKFRGGQNILLCPPSQKALSYWGVDLEEWLESTVTTIKQYTDRPIVIREKQSRRERTNVNTIGMALADDVHCMVTYNSIAAVESLIHGKPVFTVGPNAAHHLSNKDLSKIEDPYIPTLDEVHNLCCNLAYQQFTVKEMRDGTAWEMINSWEERFTGQ